MTTHDDTPDDLLDVDADRIAEEIAYKIAFREAVKLASQRAHINGEPAPVLYWTGTLGKRRSAA